MGRGAASRYWMWRVRWQWNTQRKEWKTMTSDLRWRIVTLQVVLVVVLAFTAGFLYWAAGFTHSYVHDELTAQKIAFPAASSPAIIALPASDAQAMRQYAGQA